MSSQELTYWLAFNQLSPIDASYRNGAINTALHTDICSLLATDPTWSGLDLDYRAALESHGTSLWHRLITYLAPDVLLVSIAQRLLENIKFKATSTWQTICTIEQKKPYEINARNVCVIEGKETCIVFGRAANTPFGTVSYDDKRKLGARVKELING